MIGGPPKLPPEVEVRISQLLRAYTVASNRIEKELQKASLTSFRRFRLGQHLKQIQAYITALDAIVVEATAETVRGSYGTGAEFARSALLSDGVSVGKVNLGNQIHAAGVQVVADQMAQDLLGANRSLENAARRLLRKTQQVKLDESQINDIIADGIVQGESRRNVSERLLQSLQKELGGGVRVQTLNQASGKLRTFEPGYYAEMVARTRTREAVTEGSVRFGQEYGITLFRVSVHSNPCQEICWRYQGKIYATVEGTGFPMMERRPPYHPNCKHVLTAFVPKSEREISILREFSTSGLYAADLREYQDIVAGRSAGSARIRAA